MSTIEEPGSPVNEEYLYDTVCSICQAEFLDDEDLQIHVQQVHSKYEISSNAKKCQFCTYTYGDLMSYALHFRDFHILSLNFCNYCLRAFDDEKLFKEHVMKHKSGSFRTLHSCWQCEKKLTILEMRDHDFACHKNDEEGVFIQDLLSYLSVALRVKAVTLLDSIGIDTVFICVGCDFSSTNIEIFIHHTKSSSCQVVVCSKCSNVYKNKNNLMRHLMKECSKDITSHKFRTCTGCDTLVRKSAFADHRKVCTAIRCFTCKQKFASMYKLTQHQAQAHPLSIELKKCAFCWKQCVGKFALRKHIEKSHKHEFHLYKYLCIYCNNVYKHPQKLLGHFFGTHRDISPYTCKICDSKFKLRKRFTIHIKLEHKSIGFVEFDENYHVFFTDKKSENPFIPKTIVFDDMKELMAPEENLEEIDLNSDIMNATETEANQTEVEEKLVPRRISKRKRALKPRNMDDSMEYKTIQSSDDEPLLEIKRKVQKTLPKLYRNTLSVPKSKSKMTKLDKKKLTCQVCDKYCYTIQNYEHHVSLHSKTEVKKCIKCSQVFRSKEKLNDHMATEHSSSKLTETLKTLLEKRKEGKTISDDLPMAEKFRRTIKKASILEPVTPATIKPIETNLSVQKFIESFTPDLLGDSKSQTQKDPVLDVLCDVSVRAICGMTREPSIKMTKFVQKPIKTTQKLAMPVRFKDCYKERTKISVKIVQPEIQMYNNVQDDVPDAVSDHYDDNYDDDDRNVDIPDVAEEVETIGTVEAPKPPRQLPIQQNIVIPELPNQLKNIRIAHLLPQAPYYKIVKVNEVLKTEKPDEPIDTKPIKLPDGTKLINANPLAHLLGDTSVEKIMSPIRNKYQKPTKKNYKNLLAKALSNLDKPSYLRRRQKRKAEDCSINDSTSIADSSMIDNMSVADSNMIDNMSVADSTMIDRMSAADSSTADITFTIDTSSIIDSSVVDSPYAGNEMNETEDPTMETLDETLLEEPQPKRAKPKASKKKKGPKSKMEVWSKQTESIQEDETEDTTRIEIEIGPDMPDIDATE